MKVVITIIFLLTVGAIGVGLYFVNQQPKTKVVVPLPPTSATTPTLNPSGPKISPLPTIPASWKTFTSMSYGFSIKYPADIKHDITSEGERFYKLGPSQATGTELYDGISVVIRAGSLQGKPFKEWVDQKYLEFKTDPVRPEVGDQKPITIAGMQGVSFTVSSLGDRTMMYLPKGTDQFLEITNSTVEPQDREQTFQKTVDLMLSSLEFL